MHELRTFSVVFWLSLLMFADVSMLRHLVAQKSKSVPDSLFDSTKIRNFCCYAFHPQQVLSACCFLLYRPPWWPDRASRCQTYCLVPPKYGSFVALHFTHNKSVVPFYFTDCQQDGTSLCQTAYLVPPIIFFCISPTASIVILFLFTLQTTNKTEQVCVRQPTWFHQNTEFLCVFCISPTTSIVSLFLFTLQTTNKTEQVCVRQPTWFHQNTDFFFFFCISPTTSTVSLFLFTLQTTNKTEQVCVRQPTWFHQNTNFVVVVAFHPQQVP